MLIAALFVLAAPSPGAAQQNMADVIYPAGEPRSDLISNAVPEKNRSHVSAVQAELKARGYKIRVDGAFGPKTRSALKTFQKAQGLAQTGVMDNPTLAALGVSTL